MRRDSKIGRALSGKSSRASGRMIVSKKATPSTRPGWRAAQSKASAPPHARATSASSGEPEGTGMAAKCRQMITDSQEERLYAPLLLRRRCPLFVRNHCRASTRGGTS